MAYPRQDPIGRALHDAPKGSFSSVELATPHTALAAAATLERRRREKQSPPDSPDRQSLKLALNAAFDANVLLWWGGGGGNITLADGRGISVVCASPRDAAQWLSRYIKNIGDGWQRLTTEENWTRLLDAMSALAETLPWWEVA